MKWSNLVLIFVCIFLCINVVVDSRIQQTSALAAMEMQYNLAVDNAVEAAMFQLVEMDDGIQPSLNKEEAITVFFDSLELNLGTTEPGVNRLDLERYVPVIAVILDDGFYLYRNTGSADAPVRYQKSFGTKIPYLSIENGRKLYFTMGERVRICSMEDEVLAEGNYHDLVQEYPLECFVDDGSFLRLRRQTIIQQITESMEESVNAYNDIASQFGIQYRFLLPVIEKEEWYRTIDHTSILVLFQGYPYGNRMTGYYNRVAIGGARIRK